MVPEQAIMAAATTSSFSRTPTLYIGASGALLSNNNTTSNQHCQKGKQ
jgi:hypothetical protein